MTRSVFLTRTEAAELLRLCPQTLANYAVSGEGPPFIKLGRRVVYEEEKVLRWARDRERTSTAQAAG